MSRQPLLFTSQREVSHEECKTLVQWSKDDPSQASHPRTLFVVFVVFVVEVPDQASGTAVRNYFRFYVEGTDYLDHLLFQ